MITRAFTFQNQVYDLLLLLVDFTTNLTVILGLDFEYREEALTAKRERV